MAKANLRKTQTGVPSMKAPTLLTSTVEPVNNTDEIFTPGYDMGPINLKGIGLIGQPCVFQKNPAKDVVISNASMRYSDKELEEFKVIIEKKILEAKEQHQKLLELTANSKTEGAEDTAWRGGDIIDIAQIQSDKEEFSILATRQSKLITNLQNALARIYQKTYGICRVTGQLIEKARLRAVPHATTSVTGKYILENGTATA